MLSESTNNFLSTFDSDFTFVSKNGTRNDDVFCARASGGLAILWRNQLRKFRLESSRINGIIVEGSNHKTFLFLNCYLPCDYGPTSLYSNMKHV